MGRNHLERRRRPWSLLGGNVISSEGRPGSSSTSVTSCPRFRTWNLCSEPETRIFEGHIPRGEWEAMGEGGLGGEGAGESATSGPILPWAGLEVSDASRCPQPAAGGGQSHLAPVSHWSRLPRVRGNEAPGCPPWAGPPQQQRRLLVPGKVRCSQRRREATSTSSRAPSQPALGGWLQQRMA